MSNPNLDSYTIDQLGDYYSDFSKDLYGFRMRDIAMNDREGLIAGIKRLHDSMDRKCESRDGRNELRNEGWVIDSPATAEQDGWVDYLEQCRLDDVAT